MVDAQLSTRLEDSIKMSFRSYTVKFEKKAKDERKRYIDLVEKTVKKIIKDEVKSQLLEILPKEVSDYATPVIQSTITKSLENIVLAKSFSQPKSTYENQRDLPRDIPLDSVEVLRDDYNEYKILEADFKNMHSNDFEDLQRLGDLQLGIESYQTKINLTEPRWDASDFLFKEDYTIVSKLRVMIYRDRNDQKKMLRENEVHKFSDNTLTRVMYKLDHMVKEFSLFMYNPGIENRIWSEDDTKNSEEFMEVTERILKIWRIFRSLESFVGGRFRDVDYMTLNRTE
nr:hypothetical protein [Tanacetum cinerariifolium]